MCESAPLSRDIEQDIWNWLNQFVSVPHEAYHWKFAPCPYARQAIRAGTVDVRVWQEGDVCRFLRDAAEEMRDTPALTTRVIVCPPQVRWRPGMGRYIDTLNERLIPGNVFLNPGLARTTASRFPGPGTSQPYVIVVANRLDAVLAGCESLKATHYYDTWPRRHYELVVERRAEMARRYRAR